MDEFITPSPQHSDALSEDISYHNDTSLLDRNGRVKCVKSNFKAAYKTLDPNPPKPIVRQRKTVAFWILTMLLLILAVGNLILTLTILGVLRIGHGMQSIEVLPESQSIKLYGNVDLGRIFKHNGVLEGYDGENLDITADDSSLMINLYSKLSRVFNKVKLEKNRTSFNGFESFRVNTRQQETIFDVSNPTFRNLNNINVIKSGTITTNKIRSKIDDSLKIDGEAVHFKGNEGTKIEGREIVWSSDQDIYLHSVNGSIVLSGKEGTYVDVQRLPIARVPKTSYSTAQFKICVCMPQGKLFRLPIANGNDPVYCHQADMSAAFNPCI